MRTLEVSTSGVTADADGIAQSQTPAGAGNLTINGAGVMADDGSASFYIGKVRLLPARRVTVTTAADESAKTITVYGTDRSGNAIEETLTGPNTTTGTTNKVFGSVSRVAISAAAAGAITVGWGTESVSPWIFLGTGPRHGNAGYQLDVTGTVSVDVECTYRNILRDQISGDYDASAIDAPSGTALTADAVGALTTPVYAIRMVQNSGSGSAKLRVVTSN